MDGQKRSGMSAKGDDVASTSNSGHLAAAGAVAK
jgi:hypothetical protein